MRTVGQGGAADWVVAHERLSRLAKQRAALDWEEGIALLRAARADVHRHLGYGSFTEYVERLLGYSPRSTEEKLRTAAALEVLPELEAELREGKLSWSAARELTRVATPATCRDWLDAVRGKRVREIEQLVSGRVPGDRPSDPARPELRKRVLRFEVSAETFATFREVVAHLRRKSETPLDDDALLLLMAREVLQGPSDEGRASYQIAVTTCDGCRRGFQQAAGELVELEPEVLDMALCDSQHVGVVAAGAHVGAGRASQDVPPAVRRRVLRRDHGRCVVPGCLHGTFVDVHHLKLRSEGGTHSDENLVTLCSAHHRALHRGQLSIAGSPSSGLRFCHGDGTPYGDLPRAGELAAGKKVYGGLRAMGFKERDAKHAVRVAIGRLSADATAEALLRTALALLSKP